MNKQEKGTVSLKVLGISCMILVVCVCVYLNVYKQTAVRSQVPAVTVPKTSIKNSDFQHNLDALNFSIHSSNQTINVKATTLEAGLVKEEDNKTQSHNTSFLVTGTQNSTEKLYNMVGLFTGRGTTMPHENISKSFKVPEPVANGQQAFVRIYEENDVYDKYGIWKAGGNTSHEDILMKVILESLAAKNDEDEEVVWPPTLWPLTDSVNTQENSDMISNLDESKT